ncbi:thiamine phosphate synthase [Planococcus chinensis]|uniref:Thiamine-phosphate synthase n=1 Tax=Planococcus chinensis TaxID=272917 RepID=A0ABW4QG30_9BACL
MFSRPSIYFIMGTSNAKEKEPHFLLNEALAAGITHFQLREKGETALRGEALEKFARECQALCTQYGVPFIINDDVELALAIGADGVHVGQEDMHCGDVRALIGAEKVLGVSVHSEEEAAQAIAGGADYLGMGPVFATISKNDAKEPAGVRKIIEVTRKYPQVPIVGIGGITSENANEVWQAGAAGIAVISAIAQARDVSAEIGRLRDSYERGQMI